MPRSIIPKEKFLFVFLLFGLLATQPVLAKDKIRYTKFHIHIQSKDGKTHNFIYANYINPGDRHVIAPT